MSSKGDVMYGFWYDYSIKAKNDLHASFILNPQLGGDRFYKEDYSSNAFSSVKYSRNYLLLNLGVGIKYKLHLSKSDPQKHCLVLALGDLFSYKYLYKESSTGTGVIYNQSVNYTTSYNQKLNFKSRSNRLSSFSTAFPVFLKMSYCRKGVVFSLTQYLFTQESIFGNDFAERFYTNLSVGLTL